MAGRHGLSLRVLVVNAGSSSLKLRLLNADHVVLASRDLPAERAHVDEDALAAALSEMPAPDAVGHRIVHGGAQYTEAIALDPEVVAELHALSDLAPLQQPPALAAQALVARELPATPSVGCFDTAFHASMPAACATYALPREWRERWPLRRFGFHGLSHAHVARRTPELLDRPADGLRVVSCHLGAGASLCAIADGRSIDTTMGFTPLEGLVMATRSGSVDPGLPLWLIERQGLDPAAVAHALEHESGLLGLAGTADMAELLTRAADGDVAATLALDVYVHRLRAAIAAMAVALEGIDALVFTGGVGEHAAEIRDRTASGLALLRITIDAERDEAATGDADISRPDCRIRTLVITAREDLEIARQVRAVMRRPSDPGGG